MAFPTSRRETNERRERLEARSFLFNSQIRVARIHESESRISPWEQMRISSMPFFSSFFLFFSSFSSYFEDGWGIDDCVHLTVLLYRGNMDAFRWRSIAGIGRMIDVIDIGTEIESVCWRKIVRRNGMWEKVVKIRKIDYRKFFSIQLCYFIVARFFFLCFIRKRLKILSFERVNNNKYFNYLKIASKMLLIF